MHLSLAFPESSVSPGGRAWQPTPVFLPGESHGPRSLAGYSPWVAKSQTRLSDSTATLLSLCGAFQRALACTVTLGSHTNWNNASSFLL